jgi:hypothetical protein
MTMTNQKTSARLLRRTGLNQYTIEFTDGVVSEFEYPDTTIVQLADALGFRQYIDDLEAHLEFLRVGVLLTNDPLDDLDEIMK